MAASSKTASARSETKLVQELADILDKSGLAELEYETDAVFDEAAIRIKSPSVNAKWRQWPHNRMLRQIRQ